MTGLIGERIVQVDGREARVCVSLPTPQTQDGVVLAFTCTGTIELPGEDTITIDAGGLDELQAVLLCLGALGERLRRSGSELSWIGLPGSGLPELFPAEDALVLTARMPVTLPR